MFHEKTGQSLWDNPALRNIFSTLKKKEIDQANQRKTQREAYLKTHPQRARA
jgi:hypothetical protein